MAIRLTSSNEFASLVSTLHKSPDNPDIKRKVLKHLPQMRLWAKANPLALYHLALIYHPKSPEYRRAVLKAADLGCTNAMLTACTLLMEDGEKEKAIDYLKEIKKSKDTYIIEKSKSLLANYQVNTTKNSQTKNAAKTQAHGFFTLFLEDSENNEHSEAHHSPSTR